MQNILSTLLATLLLSYISGICSPIHKHSSSIYKGRSDDTCADPTLSVVYIEVFNAAQSDHILRPRSWIVSANAINANAVGGQEAVLGEVFCAWDTAQEFTVPLYQLFNPSDDDVIYLPSTTGSPPSVSGYEDAEIVGYVYSTQVCGSVPLLGAFLQSAGDHWYTTSAHEHSSLIADGWVDAGVSAFVLPLTTGCIQG